MQNDDVSLPPAAEELKKRIFKLLMDFDEEQRGRIMAVAPTERTPAVVAAEIMQKSEDRLENLEKICRRLVDNATFRRGFDNSFVETETLEELVKLVGISGQEEE